MSIIYSMKLEIKEPHGRETRVAYFGDQFVMKRPLPGRDKDAWLKKQHRTKEIIDEIGALNNPVYNIPKMIYIKDDEYQLLEDIKKSNKILKKNTIEFFSKLPNLIVSKIFIIALKEKMFICLTI